MSEEREEDNNSETEKESKAQCPICKNGLRYVLTPNTHELVSIQCKGYSYNKFAKRNLGCDFEIYSNQKLLHPKKLNKIELKRLATGEKLRINDLNVFVDVKNPAVVEDKKTRKQKNYYLKIERDDYIEEDV